MPSSIPGYEYDVFISYRQKDNKYDGWVTEFILNLRKELEATFKEEIFIYSDENVYDGLQEIHEVKESLSSKLKCLIFIPIISQTYCDPNCYAWNNEFLVFKKIATGDPFGLKVKLQGGNVTSRIVPVRIHDLDVQDRSLLEQETGGAFRSVDFIFKAPGVNRPLRANEDHPKDNVNKTYYRDQINKVANLTKEIILALKTSGKEGIGPGPDTEAPRSVMLTRRKRNVVVSATAAVALLLLIYYSLKGNLGFNSRRDDRTAIAVIPLKAIGGGAESQYLADGVTDVIRSNLSMFPELKVKSRTSVEKYRNSQKLVPEIARELDVLYILEGSAQKIGNDIRIVVQLIDARSDINLWSEKFDKKFDNIFEIQNQISESIARSLKATLTPDIADRISRIPTSNFEAYDLFLRAKQASKRYEKTGDTTHLHFAIRLIEQSLRADTEFALGYAWLAGLKTLSGADHISDKAVKDSILLLAHRSLEIDSTVSEAFLVLSELYNLSNDDVNALRYTYSALKTEWMDSASTFQLTKRLGSIYARLGRMDAALYLFDEILKVNPEDLGVLSEEFYVLAAGHQVDKLLGLWERVKTIDPTDDLVDLILAHISLERKDYAEMEKILRHRNGRASDPQAGYDSYDVMYVFLLRKNGKEKEAGRLAKEIESQWREEDSYLKAQLRFLEGKYEVGLQLLGSEEIGWYNLNLCTINPLFENIAGDQRFKEFMERNTEAITEKRDRIRLLENKGYLQRPEEFFAKKLSAAGVGR